MTPEPHAPSYYADSVAPPPQRPALGGQVRADVCIVGAGFTGLSAALELAGRGYRVAVLEAQRVCWGASGRNGGQIGSAYPPGMAWLGRWVGAGEAASLFALSEAAKALIRRRVAEHDIACDLKAGCFHAAGKARHMAEIRATAALWTEAYGYPGLDVAEGTAAARAYVNSPGYVGGLYDPGAGHLHPLNSGLGLAAAVEAAGAAIYEASPVIAVAGVEPGARAAAATTPQGRVEADHLILCGNAYLGDLVPAIRRYYAPLGSYIVATEPLGARAAQVIPADCAVFDSNHLLSYYRLSADGRLLFGGRTAVSPLGEPDPRGFLGARIRALFPQIADAGLAYAWGGQLAMTASRMPQVGRLGGRVSFAHGYSGEGVAMSGLVGQVLAEAVAGQMERFDIFARLPHRVFPGGRLLQKPALALALLWFRLCDLVP
ncbi:MAG: FAD-binding oxidoreductase [Kiloniellales bacterium]|nr:FAD-binding oxidoreductase [Kiloniellales bacterium]